MKQPKNVKSAVGEVIKRVRMRSMASRSSFSLAFDARMAWPAWYISALNAAINEMSAKSSNVRARRRPCFLRACLAVMKYAR